MDDEFIQQLQKSVRSVPDFPIQGIMFRDITPVLADGKLLVDVVDRMVRDIEGLGWEPTHIVGPESRGFIFGSMVALQMGIGFIPVRKPGKLPHEIERIEYSLEYGENVLEIHKDALSEDDRVVIVDDLLATGGTVAASVQLCQRIGAPVLGGVFLIELDGLNGSENSGIDTYALLNYPA
ncbi:MAG: adenine phosphoribosyltransferase [Candidatus Thalassarchaeaceae archaeon]|nr:MAG: adenine phosphoribosyltransferase [Euryarchaeota archaeon]RPG74441.1 MAG: adenine phosphoribosyltransferase [Euryarchaeota archaeon TMED85]|tara:strand:+ start:512 stop:1051 length:540 start_codon:yes stop_codon:yes gene_type:complete